MLGVLLATDAAQRTYELKAFSGQARCAHMPTASYG